MGWFFGGLLHLAADDRGELLACCLTPGNVDDCAPVPALVKKLHGKLFGDRGYISAPLTQMLFEQGRASRHSTAEKHEEPSHAPFGYTPGAQTGHYRVHYRPTQEYLAH
jgi:hypothetical protein